MNLKHSFLLPLLTTASILGSASESRAQFRDLVISDLQVQPWVILAGETIPVQITVTNNGLQQARRNRAEIRLDAGTQLIVLDSFEVPRLDPNRSFTTTRTVRLPSSTSYSGIARIQAEVDVDNVVQELIETDNRASDPISHQPAADLAMNDIRVSTTDWERGQSYSFTCDFENLGALSSGPFDIELFLSRDAQIGTNDFSLATGSYLNLSAGGSVARRLTVTLPQSWPLGPCYIGCIVDVHDSVQEGDDANNTFVLSGAHVISSGASGFGSGCQGAVGVPRLQSTITPQEGAIGRFEVTRAGLNRTVAFVFGASNSQWTGLALPLDLGFAGAAGCSLLVSPDIITTTTSVSGGTAAQQILYPVGSAGATVYVQSIVLDPSLPTGLATSNGVEVRVGT